jgi:plastocyanin
MRASVAALVLAAALAVAGCGSGGSSGSKSSPATSSPAAKTTAVTLQNFAFNPSNLTAKVGQTITWTNRDSVAHNVTAKKGDNFHSTTLNPGQSYSHKLDHAGTISYVCTIHPNMKATLTVTK